VEFKKSYTGEEDKARFMLFVDTLAQIDKHNEKFAKGLAEVEAGLNEYSDWSDDEKQKLLR
jgi:Cathepsin propeptide inhibitor domain (I29)